MVNLCDFRRETITLQEYIPKERRRQYYQLHFSVPENVCRIDIEYFYDCQGNIIDLALLDYAGNYVGSSGSDKRHIYISGWASTPGYSRAETKAGEWAVIIGAYQVQDIGVNVTYRVTFTYRQRTLLRGDTHVHTTASDGSLETGSVVSAARKSGLDYIFITDHNNYSQNYMLPMESDITVLPGMEWTHYDGHAGLLGVQRPINHAFCINHEKEAWELLDQARQNGAVVVLNHPFCPACGWHFGMERDGYDMIELINGGLEYSANRKCLMWWHQKLCEGKRIPVLGGSDFHRPDGMHCIGRPQTCIYAFSPSPDDIIGALRNGNGYVVTREDAPSLWVESSGKILGEKVSCGDNVEIRFRELLKGDALRLVTDRSAEEIDCKENRSFMDLQRIYPEEKFVRFEVVRDGKEILISNPLYFEQNKK